MERGHGLESIFGELFCSVFPLIKKYAPVIGQKALQMDVRIANVVAEAQSLKNAAKTRLFGALEEGINNFVPQAEGQSGLGNQKKRSHCHPPRCKQTKRKRRKLDIFL